MAFQSSERRSKLSPEYLDYIASDHWRDVRSAALRVYGRRCAGCMASDSIHMHHLFYPRVLEQTTVAHILPLCEACHEATHKQRLFHPTVFDESKCAEKRRETIVFLQARQSAKAELARKRREDFERRNQRKSPKQQPGEKLKRMLDRWQPLRPRATKSHIFMTHEEYQRRMPARTT